MRVYSGSVKLRDYLDRYGITISTMARSLGMSRATISKLVNGKGRPSWRTAQRVQNYTQGEVSASSWFGGES